MQYSFIHSAVQIVISVLGLGSAGGCLYAIYKMEPSRDQTLVMLLSCFVAVVWVSCVIYNSGISVEVEILGVEILIFCSGFIYELVAFIFCRICSLRIPRACWVVLMCCNVFEIILGWAFKYNGVYYGLGVFFGLVDPGNAFKNDFSLNYDMLIVTLIIYMIVFSILFVYKIVSDKEGSVLEMLFFYVSIMLPTGVYFLLRFCFKHVILLTPIATGLLVTELSFIYLIKKGSLFDIHKFAFEKIMQTIDDGIIILDSSYTVRYMNLIAKRVYGQYMTFNNSMCFDKRQVDMLIANTEQQKQLLFLKLFPENYLKYNDRCYYEQAFILADERKKIRGYVIVAKDITMHYREYVAVIDQKAHLECEVQKRTEKLVERQIKMIAAFSSMLEEKSTFTGGHVKRTSGYVSIIAKELYKRGTYGEITEDYARLLEQVAPLHDIGKITVPDVILEKCGKLSDEEFKVIKQHAQSGGELIDRNFKEILDPPLYELAKEVAYYHHEKWDGSGYFGLRGTAIPLAARIMALADVFDALVSERPYKLAFSLAEAFDIIGRGRCSAFDPLLVDVFFGIRKDIETFYTQCTA